MYDGKGDKSFIDWITQVKKITKLTQHLHIQLAQAKAEDIVFKLIGGIPPSLMWDTVKKMIVLGII